MENENDDLSRVFNIERLQLDIEWVSQPKLFFEYSKKMDIAKDKLERSKTNLDVVTAEVDRLIRKNPAKYGLEKITDPTIKLAIVRHPKYQEAVEKVNRYRHKYDVSLSIVKALDHRKKALENLVDLHGQSYFSAPITRNKSSSEEALKHTTRRKCIIKRRDNKEQEDD